SVTAFPPESPRLYPYPRLALSYPELPAARRRRSSFPPLPTSIESLSPRSDSARDIRPSSRRAGNLLWSTGWYSSQWRAPPVDIYHPCQYEPTAMRLLP